MRSARPAWLTPLSISLARVDSFIPPLNISKEDMAKACDIIRNAITEVVKEG